MLVIVLSIILQSACVLNKPAFFRAATPPTPYLRALRPEARAIQEYNAAEKSLSKVWDNNAKIRITLGSQFLDDKKTSSLAQSVKTPIEHSGGAKKDSPPEGIRCGIFTCYSNLIPKVWYERARRKHFLDKQVELVRLLTQGYHKLKDGDVAGAKKVVGRAEKIQANMELLGPNIPSIHLLENDRYRRSLEEFIHAQHHFSGPLVRVKLIEAIQKLAENRIAIAERWSKPRVARGDTTPQDPVGQITNWLSGSRTKNMAIQATIRAVRSEIKARQARGKGDYVKALRGISKAQRLQAEAERLRAQIPHASEAIINLMDVPEYRTTTKPLRIPHIMDQIMQSRLKLGFELIRGQPRYPEPVEQDPARRGWLTRFAYWLFD